MAKYALMGIGNDMRGDDAAGVLIARGFSKIAGKDWLVLDCGTTPEDFTGEIRRQKPHIVFLVDAADVSLPPGSIRLIPKEKIGVFSITTHHMPLSMLSDYIEEITGKDSVKLIGIQPKSTGFGMPVSEEVRGAVDEIVEILKNGRWRQIPSLS